MRELLVATKNQGKLREICILLKGLGLKITSLADYPESPPIIEDGKTFRSNALKKALTIGCLTHKLVMGEDSGLEVASLGNQPGVYSARYSGKQATDQKNNAKLLRALKGQPYEKRRARYRCFIALVDGHSVVDVVHGQCTGYIMTRHRGKNGFGYDPLFLIHRYQKTFGELEPSIKAKISHRARALNKLKCVLSQYLV